MFGFLCSLFFATAIFLLGRNGFSPNIPVGVLAGILVAISTSALLWKVMERTDSIVGRYQDGLRRNKYRYLPYSVVVGLLLGIGVFITTLPMLDMDHILGIILTDVLGGFLVFVSMIMAITGILKRTRIASQELLALLEARS